MPEKLPIQIFFSDEFKSRLRSLAKRYHSIRNDLQTLLDDLQNGEIISDQIRGIGSTPVTLYNQQNSLGRSINKNS